MDGYDIFDAFRDRGLIPARVEEMVTEDYDAGEPESGTAVILDAMLGDGVYAPPDLLDAIDDTMQHGWPPDEWCLHAVKCHRDASGYHRPAAEVPYRCTCEAPPPDEMYRC